MSQLSRNPTIIKLAYDLGLSIEGDCVAAIRDYAIASALSLGEQALGSSNPLMIFRQLMLNQQRMRLEVIRTDSDIIGISKKHRDFHSDLAVCLREEFLDGRTEGMTLERENWDPILFRYLAVVDARGLRISRAFFTAWHEITHLVVHAPQQRFPRFRRSPGTDVRIRDPLESLVDHISGDLAFFRPLFKPILEDIIHRGGEITFRTFEAARKAMDPPASLLSTAIGSLSVIDLPMVLVEIAQAHKKCDARTAASGQGLFDFFELPLAEVRAVKVIRNGSAQSSAMRIRPNMRVPHDSVLLHAFRNPGDVDLSADENQRWWKTAKAGSLPSLDLVVHAVRRGKYVYGLITPKPPATLH